MELEKAQQIGDGAVKLLFPYCKRIEGCDRCHSNPIKEYRDWKRLMGNEMNNPEVVFDPRLGLQGGSRCRDSRTGKFAPNPDKKRKPKGIMFKCKFCGQSKPLDEMRVLARFFPPLWACRECEMRIG